MHNVPPVCLNRVDCKADRRYFVIITGHYLCAGLMTKSFLRLLVSFLPSTQTLTARGFDVEQYLLSPVQLGIPNTRLRYYCLASRRHTDGDGRVSAIKESLPQNSPLQPDEPTVPLRPLSEFLVSAFDKPQRKKVK